MVDFIQSLAGLTFVLSGTFYLYFSTHVLGEDSYDDTGH